MAAWDEVADGVLAHDDRRGIWSLRTHAIVLRDGSLAVLSPTRALPGEVHDALADAGEPSLLVAPNHFHHLGLSEWLARHPRARVVAAHAARPRLSRKQRGLEVGAIAALDAALPPAITTLEPPGLANGELWLRIETERGIAWLVGDAFFAHPTVPGGIAGAFFRITRTAPGLQLGRTFTTLAVRDRAVYRGWLLDRLERDRPVTLIPSHGDVIHDPALAERLGALARERL